MGRDLGALGESVLPGWAAQVGLICNPSTKDKAGWDYILESPDTYRVAAATDKPLDVASTALQCLVQVKATDKRNDRIQVKLSNWDRLVKSPLPAFFLVLEFDGGPQPQRAYLIHVGEVWIRGVLQRERELGSGSAKQLHKKTMSLNYSDDSQLPALSGGALWGAITRTVGDPARYHQDKARWTQTVGYEGNPPQIQGNLTFDLQPGQSPEEALVDFSLGIIPEAVARDLMKVDMRFGIAAPPMRFKEAGEEVIVTSKLGEGTDAVMTLHTGDARFDTRLGLKLHLPPLGALGVDSRFAKLRLLGKGIDVQLHGSKEKGKLNLTLPEGYINQRLSELRPLARVIQAIAHTRDAGRDLHFTLSVGGHTSRGGFGVRGVDLGFEPIAKVVLQAHEVADRCQIDGAEATLESLWRQKATIELLHSLLHGSEIWMRVETSVDVEERSGPIVILPEVVTVQLASYRLYFAIAVYGDLGTTQREGNRCTIHSREAHILGHEIRIGEHDPGATASALIAAAAEQLESFAGPVVVPADPERLL